MISFLIAIGRVTIEASRFRDKRPVNKLQLPFTPDKGEIQAEIFARLLRAKERCVPAQFIDTRPPFIPPIAETLEKKRRKEKNARRVVE